MYNNIIFIMLFYISRRNIYIQLKKNKLNIDNLLSKQPIVIEDDIDSTFIKNIFKYNKIFKFNSKNLWERTQFKYTLLYAKNDTNIFISNPKQFKNIIPNVDDIVINIKLNKNKSIILPFKWYYSLDNKNNILIYGIHDYITLFFSFIFS